MDITLYIECVMSKISSLEFSIYYLSTDYFDINMNILLLRWLDNKQIIDDVGTTLNRYRR